MVASDLAPPRPRHLHRVDRLLLRGMLAIQCASDRSGGRLNAVSEPQPSTALRPSVHPVDPADEGSVIVSEEIVATRGGRVGAGPNDGHACLIPWSESYRCSFFVLMKVPIMQATQIAQVAELSDAEHVAIAYQEAAGGDVSTALLFAVEDILTLERKLDAAIGKVSLGFVRGQLDSGS
ncbi:hypothetical protein IPV08_16125 [Methylobacterium sp. SD274]|uniref:hypothetical protein n=1 Tax=Methylobacterium sp. SD274 TaxID=2782009 RepID=UPI001A97407E|nr:hypothetical protein [Methylobacterium sp. SD274]MBO1021488.1 hypothetical protein [Methylobacterium sp. SD274]